MLVEAFRDEQVGAVHVGSEHFRAAQVQLPLHLAEAPRIINATVPGTEWSDGYLLGSAGLLGIVIGGVAIGIQLARD